MGDCFCTIGHSVRLSQIECTKNTDSEMAHLARQIPCVDCVKYSYTTQETPEGAYADESWTFDECLPIKQKGGAKNWNAMVVAGWVLKQTVLHSAMCSHRVSSSATFGSFASKCSAMSRGTFKMVLSLLANTDVIDGTSGGNLVKKYLYFNMGTWY